MLQGKILLRLMLLGTVVLGASTLTSTTASAANAVFALCAQKVSGLSIAPFANSEKCDKDEAGGGSATGWAHIYPINPNTPEVLFCAEET
jgi:hypothetical protein